jgi:hypothetical protein
VLQQLGVDDPQRLILDLDTEFVSQISDAERAAAAARLGTLKGMGRPSDLAEIILGDRWPKGCGSS